MYFRFSMILAAGLLLVAAGVSFSAEPIDADLLLRNGTLIDGTGAESSRGDVAILGQRIVAVGDFTVGKVGREIDCQGLVIAPGFIDLHNHSDWPILKDSTRPALNYLTQGCTTIVTGNCGAGHVDVGEYLRKLDDAPPGVNVVHLLPQGSLRSKVMGSVRRAATAEELQEMRESADKAMSDGAWGMSTGLIYVPGSYAETDEIASIARVVARSGGIYASHIRGESGTLLDAVKEALSIGRQAKLPVHISHFKCVGKPYWGTVRLAAGLIEEARSAGQRVTADQYPYIASSTSLAAMLLPAAAREGGSKATTLRMNDPEQLPELREQIVQAMKVRDKLQIASYSKRPEWVGKLLTEIAADENCEVVDVAVEILASGGAGAVNFGMTENDVRYVMQLPWVATASDGGVKVAGEDRPHPRSFGTFPRKLGHYAVGEKVISLEHAVRSSSGLPADILGLADRGYLRAGLVADVVVFDPLQIIDKATFDQPYEYSQGVRHVLVNGNLAIADGKPAEEQYGRALRHESKAAAE